MENKFFKAIYVLALCTLCSYAQAQKVSGTVSDANGPLPGASVVVKGTSKGTTTDFDGNFSIDNVGENAVLVVSYIGYVTQEVAVAGQSDVNVTLQEDASELEEVVIVGYSSQVRGDISGSVASVDMEEAVKVPIANAAQSLQGRVTGVSVVTNNTPGQAPKIVVRGLGTTNNTNPLYIIDGVQTDDPNVLNSINPNDIDQMNVLKDAAASVYGARASNGVVIVTTKSGGYNMDKAVVNIDMYTGIATPTNLPSLLNAEQHKDMVFQSLTNSGATDFTHPQYDPTGTGTYTVPSVLNGTPAGVTATVKPGGTYWPDEVTRNAPTSNLSFSLQNGTKTGTYFLSANYLSMDGVMNNTFFKRGTTRLNSEFKISDRLKIGEHVNVSLTHDNSGNGEAFENSFRSNPLIPVRDDAGNFAGTYSNSNGLGNARNPVAQNYRHRDNYGKSTRVFGDIYAILELTDDLTVKTSFGGGVNNYDNRNFSPLDPEHGEKKEKNELRMEDVTAYNWVWTNTINYKKSFGEHDVNVMLGTEAAKENGNGKRISRTSYLFEDPDYYNLQTAADPPNVDYAYFYKNSLFSIFGSVNYSYAGKYFLTGTLRKDTSSRFLGDKKSGIFPSFSVGWLVSQEDFFPSDGFVSRLKLKGSYGVLGNQTLPRSTPGINISRLSEEYANYAINGTSVSTGVFQERTGNPELEWELSKTTNFGVELGFLENKLNVELEFYQITTDGLIEENVNLIATTGPDTDPPLDNLGSVKNTGFDLALGFADETDSGWSYGISANISRYKNEVTELRNVAFLIGSGVYRNGAITRTEVGRPISSFYGFRVTGYDDKGRFTYKENDGVDGINDSDREYIGSPHPDFTYGINLNAGYKGFDFSAFFTGSQGNDIYNYNKIYTDFPTFFDGNRSTRVLDSWTPTNTDAALPALSTGVLNNETNPNSHFVEDGSYFRLKNLQIGYTLPNNLVSKLKIEKVRFYLQGTNLFTLTSYDGLDPELVPRSNRTMGVDWQVYPVSKMYTIGVNIKL